MVEDTATMATPQIYDTILDALGNTPLVRMRRVTQGVKTQVLAKCEFMNPGGSVKDRIGIAMIEEAERSGRLKPGGTIIEPTSGNTGVGLAIAAAIKGYKTIFVMPDKMSEEKVRLLRAFGAKVVITPTAVEPDDPRSYYSVSRRLAEETPNALLAGQYWNQANPEAHYRTTGPELWRQTGGRIDAFFAGMGTGGTISGTARFLKEQNPAIKIIGIDPVGSLFTHYYRTGELGGVHAYKIEGVGEDFLPTTMHFQYVDDVVQIADKEAFLMTRRLVREEGLFCGGSAGMAVAGALHWLREHSWDSDKTVVVLLPDSGSRYLSKIFSEDWMREHGFLESEPVSMLIESRPHQLVTARRSDTVGAVIRKMKEYDISQMPVIDDQDVLQGMITEVALLDYMLGDGSMEHAIADIIDTDVATVSRHTSIDMLSDIFSRGQVAVVVDEQDRAVDIVTKIDLIDYLANKR